MVAYILSVIPIVAVYVILAVSLNIVMGNTGVLTVAQAAFMGIGAYATAVLTVDHGWPMIATIPVGWAISGLLGAFLLLPALRVRGLLYAVISFAFMIVISGVFENATSLTGGANGVAGIPFFTIGPLTITTNLQYTIAYGLIAVLVICVHWRIAESRLGVVLRAVRDDTGAADSYGVDTVRARLKVFVVGACIASLSGSLYAPLIRYVDPTNFSVTLSFQAISMVVLGGTGSVIGAVLGATLITLLPDAITFLNLSSTTGGALEQVIYAAAIILVLRLRPQGLIPERPWKLRRAVGTAVDTEHESAPAFAAAADRGER